MSYFDQRQFARRNRIVFSKSFFIKVLKFDRIIRIKEKTLSLVTGAACKAITVCAIFCKISGLRDFAVMTISFDVLSVFFLSFNAPIKFVLNCCSGDDLSVVFPFSICGVLHADHDAFQSPRYQKQKLKFRLY